MNKPLVAALIAASFISFEARAQERAGSAALGAVSGAVVLGPVGAVAGAFIGYTAGPAIARSWGVGRSGSRSRARHAAQSSPGTQQQAVAQVSSPPPVRTAGPRSARNAAPPVQGFE
ncbi:MAG: DNA-directed RNA polymerase subunit N [Bradyrhizobium sp.]